MKMRKAVKEAIEQLDKKQDELESALKAIERDYLQSGLNDGELKAFEFLQNLVKTHKTTNEQVKKVFLLCVKAHEEYREPMAAFKTVRALFTIKGAIAVIACVIAATAYKFMYGEI